MRFDPLRLAAILAACAYALLATAVSAQTMLQPGVRVAGTLGPNSPKFNSGVRYDCYMLSTTRGSRWVIDMEGQFDTQLWLAIGEDCASITSQNWIRNDDDGAGFLQTNARMVFNAGGGSYLIVARGYEDSAAGPYTLVARQEPGQYGSGMMRPGLDIIRIDPSPQTASTVGGEPSSQPAGTVFRDCEACPSMVVVAPGSFMMGSPGEEVGRQATEGPRHVVTLNRPFAIGQHEVTFDQYDACVADRGCAAVADNGWGRGRRPVINVTFYDALRYVEWLSRRTGQRYFLPSESEWEYAARAGSDTPWNTGSAIIPDDANIVNTFARTVPVGSYASNAFGLFDAHGNVWEWTLDCIDTGYIGVPTNGAFVNANCQDRTVFRGGGYDSTTDFARSAARGFNKRSTRSTLIGFRVTRALEERGAGSGPEQAVAADAINPSGMRSDEIAGSAVASTTGAAAAGRLAIGRAEFSSSIGDRVGCRGVPVNLTRAGDLNQALSGMLEQSLRQRSLYDPEGTRMQLIVDAVSVNSFGNAAWTIQLTATSERLPSGFTVTALHSFESHFVADIACRRAEEAFGDALAKAVEAVLNHPDFRRL